MLTRSARSAVCFLFPVHYDRQRQPVDLRGPRDLEFLLPSRGKPNAVNRLGKEEVLVARCSYLIRSAGFHIQMVLQKT
jgi:hypothetical protein